VTLYCQSYLLSIRPFLHPRINHEKKASTTESSVAGGPDSKTLTTSSDQDEVFSWGRDIDVDYKNLMWVTFRDQVSMLEYDVDIELIDMVFTACISSCARILLGRAHSIHVGILISWPNSSIPGIASIQGSDHRW
jgi:hypothetical protein